MADVGGRGRARAGAGGGAAYAPPVTVAAPVTDGDVPAFWQSLGLPGLVDVHVHFMPHRVLEKVWHYFDSAGPLLGRPWPVYYREGEGQRLARLRALGVLAFPSLVYAHKPGMAAWLTDWSLGFAAEQPDVLATGTFFPEPGVAGYVADGLARGVRVWKVHVQVGGYDPREPVLDEVWGLLSDAGTPVVAHVGSGPTPGAFTGPGPFGEVLARHPRLPAVIAHLGMPEAPAFMAMAERYERVRLDTTMAFVDFWGPGEQLGPGLDLGALRALGEAGKVLLGSDFPNIPYPYAHQLEALARLDLGDAWLREVCWGAGARLFGVDAVGGVPA